MWDFIYFSTLTIRTLGYGDIQPMQTGVRVWTPLESVVGAFAMALVISRIVSGLPRAAIHEDLSEDRRN